MVPPGNTPSAIVNDIPRIGRIMVHKVYEAPVWKERPIQYKKHYCTLTMEGPEICKLTQKTRNIANTWDTFEDAERSAQISAIMKDYTTGAVLWKARHQLMPGTLEDLESSLLDLLDKDFRRACALPDADKAPTPEAILLASTVRDVTLLISSTQSYSLHQSGLDKLT